MATSITESAQAPVMAKEGKSERTRVAIIDDETGMHYIFSQHLPADRYEVEAYGCAEEFFSAHAHQGGAPHLVLLDYNIPEHMNGLEALRQIKDVLPTTEVVMLTAHGDTRIVVEAIRSGAFDYLLKPCSSDELLVTAERAMEHRFLISEVESLRSTLRNRQSLAEVMGASPEIKRVHENVERVASTNFSVLVQGESGTGKEVIARAMHDMSNRRDKPFVAVDCGAIPSTLIESELFGYEKGAFTGADKRKEGLFEAAADGTLFLDEIANIPIETQGKLLRAIQEKKIMRVGGTQEIPIDLRLISATNLPLDEATRSGRFRLDLFYRLNEFTIYLPSLRHRREDVVFLTNRFIREANTELGKQIGSINKPAVETLLHYQWPGNVRELKNVIRRAVLMADREITPNHLIFDYQTSATSGAQSGTILTLREVRKAAEKEAIQTALRLCDGNKSEVSRMLEVDYKTLLTKIKEYALEK